MFPKFVTYPVLLINFLLANLIAETASGNLSDNSVDNTEIVYELSDFVVTESEEDQGYYSANSTSITKANELIKNTPVNVSVINEELLADLGIKTVEDLAQVSASIDTDPTGYSLDQIRIRGFRSTHTRYNSFRRNLPRDSYNISRFDIIKGSNSLIFGQASPGGLVNALPLLANFRDDALSMKAEYGNKDFNRKVFNANKVVSDALAVRFMKVDHHQGYEHKYKKYDLLSDTLSFSLRPDDNTLIQGHFEKVDATFNFPAISMRDRTYLDDSVEDDPNLNNSGSFPESIDSILTNVLLPFKYENYDGFLSVEDSNSTNRNYDYSVPYSPDWVDYAPQSLIDRIIQQTASNTNPDSVEAPGNSGFKITSRDDLKNYYSEINIDNYGYQSGPDKHKDIDGRYNTITLQKVLSDSLELNVIFNKQNNKGSNLARDYHGISRIVDSYARYTDYPRPSGHVYDDILNYRTGEDDDSPEKFIKTYWIKTEGENNSDGLNATLLWNKEYKGTDNKILFGINRITTEKDEINYDQVPISAVNPDGSFLTDETSDATLRTAWVTNNSITDRERAFEYISIDRGFDVTDDRTILAFNEDIESDFSGNTTTGLYRIPTYDSNGTLSGYSLTNRNNALFTDKAVGSVRSEKATWAESTYKEASIKTDSEWFAVQTSALNGKLRTLIGCRYDDIEVSSILRKVSLFGFYNNASLSITDPDGNDRQNNRQNKRYTKYSPSFGALYWINNNLGIFGNYAESIETPTGQDRTPIGTLAPPEYGKGYEIGIRFSNPLNSIDGQLTFYSIEKENDDEFAYSNSLLKAIYPKEIYGDLYPEIYYDNGSIRTAGLPGRRGEGDVTLSEGIELDINYNPFQSFTLINSINYTVTNSILELHPLVDNVDDYDLFGRPKFRVSVTGKYSHRYGKLKGLSYGISQLFRSGSKQTSFNFENDDGSVDKIFLKFDDEYTTNGFITYQSKLSFLPSSPKYYLTLRVNNLLDNQDFIGRGNYGFYKESRSYMLGAKIVF